MKGIGGIDGRGRVVHEWEFLVQKQIHFCP